jgi:hypothetical protein
MARTESEKEYFGIFLNMARKYFDISEEDMTQQFMRIIWESLECWKCGLLHNPGQTGLFLK